MSTNLTAYTLLAGGVLCFAVFSWYPTVRAFQHTNFVGTTQWVGLRNFHRLFADPEFTAAWRNTFEFTGVALVLGFAVPFAPAVVLNEIRHLRFPACALSIMLFVFLGIFSALYLRLTRHAD